MNRKIQQSQTMNKENSHINRTPVITRKRPPEENSCSKSSKMAKKYGANYIDWDEDIENANCNENIEDANWNQDIEDIDWDEDIEQFQDQSISFNLNDYELVRDLTEFEFEMGKNDSKNSSVLIEPNTFYGLPLSVQNVLKAERNISELYEWQDTLLRKLISHDRNLVYCVPTSGGKTLVAELMILREIMLNKKNALFIFPYVSIVQEKLRSLIPFSIAFNFTLEEYAGDKGAMPIKKRTNQNSLYIASYEKAHLLLTCLEEEKRLDEIGIIVVDELHMIGDGTTRGCTLESLLLLCILAKNQKRFDARLIAMSATLSNFDQIAQFLDAVIEHRDFRPVELVEYIKYDQKIYKFDESNKDSLFKKEERTLKKSSKPLADPDNLAGLVQESMPNSPLLIFCPTKSNCENVVKLLCSLLPDKLKNHKKVHRLNVLKGLQALTDASICDILKISIPYGIAYHHSGLTSEEREIIESAFLNGHLCVIVCTSTLAAGVNLPAQRVIIRSPYVARNFITPSQYKQMVGRAGRAGLSERGESILMIKDNDLPNLQSLFVNVQNECISSIKKNPEQGISRIFLSLIHLKLANNFDEIRDIFQNKTLLGIQSTNCDQFENILDENMAKFYELGLIQKPEDTQDQIQVTKLGKGAVKGLIDIDKCSRLYSDLKLVSNSVSLANKFHLFYICTLIFNIDELPTNIDRSYLHETFFRLNKEEKLAAKLVGITEAEVNDYFLSSTVPANISRFFFALIVYETYKCKTPLHDLSLRCKIPKGTLQQFFNRFSTNSMSLLRFIEELDDLWGLHQLLISICSDLCLCSSPELVPLLELPHVRIARAKQLFNSGYKTLEEVAQADKKELRRKLDYKIKDKEANDIIQYARKIFSDKANVLKAETARYLKIANLE